MARAALRNGQYVAHAPEPVGDASTLIHRLRLYAAADTTILLGFDFPIGLPLSYAERMGVKEFLALLPEFGSGEWSDFYDVAERAEQISLRRPFYPKRPSHTRLHHLLDTLDVESVDHLLRRCDKAHAGRQAAAPIFWTMGAKQVGKAAISGWRDVLAPALRSPVLDVAVWPFDGTLDELLRQRHSVIAETYPAEFYRHLGLDVRSKRDRADRQANAPALLRWADEINVALSPEMRSAIEDGFGSLSDGDDQFDATVGLFGMLNVVLGRRSPGEPEDSTICRIEGWMLGRSSDSNNDLKRRPKRAEP